MIFRFSIPAPKRCIECQFKEVHPTPGYGPLVVRCLIIPTVNIPIKVALEGRYEKCPGILEDNE